MASKEDLEVLLVPVVRAALDEPDHSMRMTLIRDAGGLAFAEAYDDAGGDPDRYERASMEFLNTLTSAATHTQPDGSPEQIDRVTSLLATAAANAAVVAAAEPGTELEWITRLDDAVRDLHRPLHGEVRAAGTPFIVGGVPLLYPGQPVGPPEGWINCRCVLHAALTAGGAMDDALVAVSDKPWSDFSASDYTIEQWRRACLLKMPGGDPDAKGTYKLPVREPSGALNRNGVHAAASALAGGRGGVNAPAEVQATAKRKLRALYSQLGEDPPDSLKAASDAAVVRESLDDTTGSPNHDSVVARAGPSAPGTHDAPGWITNPRETQRLRTYWTRGEGAAKIRWGQPGDFDRCRKQLRKYIPNPSYLAGTCANMHFVALGFWPNQGPHAGKHRGGKRGLPGSAECSECENFDPDNTTHEGAAVTAAFAAVADTEEWLPPREWFTDPGFDGPTALTATDDGEVMGHIGQWDQCHTGYGDTCVPPPHSTRDYHHFRTGYVQTAGGNVAVGNLTLGTLHAPDGIGAAATVAHYENTGAAVADVAAGEDAYGIWVHGMLRPGVTREQVHALRAGTVSGDWRTFGGQYELVAALVVNVPGFPIPRPVETLAAGGQPLSLVAAGIVTVDPNALDVDRIAIAVVDRLAVNERRAANVARVAALRASLNGERVRELAAAIGDHG